MKKLITIILCVILACSMLGACNASQGVSQDEYNKVTSENAELQSTVQSLKAQLKVLANMANSKDNTSDTETDNNTDVHSENPSDEADTTDSNKDVDVTTYYLNGKYNNYGVFVIKNNTKTTLKVDINASFKDANGKLIGAKTVGEDAITGGQEIALYTLCDETISSIEYDVSTKEDDYYKGVIQNIKHEKSLTENKCIVSATNTGKDVVEFAECTVLFFMGSDLVGVSNTYIIDDDSELKPGKTRTAELSCYEVFDSVKIYFSGRVNK